ncbi:hypothetical protein FC50_GL001661 [Lacticaseibacillus pantheris DSM 15945 = JCM 12539 = NBRC 106106]|uniref:Hydrogenase n=1 Tax=Lacticaseibacillus pantheris DSM 15945 = JCM 12539 = NBRC 106106 TaxID=1423783 RepID=A0A0R1TWD8_9LACO|nr:DUF3737 family protein [Lacticaseibacillus pantheris]KRL85495.1 hypothetical protein FC50_GL001661 [Lacticaseibacillus pantheris DSM 15945 = JCM 12539 = NBRC 106106]
MTQYTNTYLEGERALFAEQDAVINGTVFDAGESPLKESSNIQLNDSIFKWKYPLWYSQHIQANQTTFETMARSGIWYTHDITITNSALQAPKLFRRNSKIRLNHVHFADAEETMWSCDDIRLTDVQINGNYFGKDSSNIYLDHVDLVGNYCFDGAKNVEAHHSTFVSKDAFWNCENVTLYDSTITGEYLAWNTKNLTLINCTIESNQGLCYVEHLTMKNCRLLHTDLAFEYCSEIDAEITSDILSVKNPLSGRIHAHGIKSLILDASKIDPSKTQIITQLPITERKSA